LFEGIAFRSTEPFDGSSTQRSDFVSRPVERVRRPEPETYRKPEGELDLNTTAKMAYTRKPMEKATPIKPQETHVAPGKFEGTSTSQVSGSLSLYIGLYSGNLSLVHTGALATASPVLTRLYTLQIYWIFVLVCLLATGVDRFLWQTIHPTAKVSKK